MRWLRPLLRRSAVEREMDDELRFHLDRLTNDYLQRGLSLQEARRRARIEFGGLDQVKDDARQARLADHLDRVWRGFRIACRNLARSPAFTFVVVTILALGMGVNTLVFSILDQLLLRNLPVHDPERLVVFHGNFVTPGMYRSTGRLLSFSWPKYQDFRVHCPVFSGVAARFFTPGTLEYGGEAESVGVELVSGNYFDVLGVRPAAGRLFTPADDRTNMGAPLVVLGYSYWRRRFASDPSIIGQQVRVSGLPMTVVGVSAAGFHSIERGADEDLRVPMVMKDLFTPSWRGLNDRSWAWLNIIARVKPGLSLRQAETGANVYYRQVLQEEAKSFSPEFAHRQEFLNDHLDLLPAAAGIMDQIQGLKSFFLELMAIAGLVLLIACVNLAGLLLARTAARHRELGIRLALGVGRLGLVRQLLAENMVLILAGGSLGVMLATALLRPATRFLVSADADQLTDTAFDWRMLLFASAMAVATALVFAIVPVFEMRKMELVDALKTGGAGSGRGQVRLRKLLVAAQLALCVWLVITAGLFARSLGQIKSVDLGFIKERLITFHLDAMQSGYKEDACADAYRRIVAALASVAGVVGVANSDYGILTGGVNVNALAIDGYKPPPPDRFTLVRELLVSPGYIKTMGMRIVAGRDFAASDIQAPARVTIVNQDFVRQYCAGRNPLGRFIGWSDGKTRFEIIGVVADQRYDGPAAPLHPFYYLPEEQNGPLSFYLRTSRSPEALFPAIRRVVAHEAPGVPIDQLRTVEDFFNANIEDQSRISALATSFGFLATLLAAIGLYGVVAYTVARRTREIGVRMALGAMRADVLRLVIRDILPTLAAALIIGLPTGLAVARLIRSQLFDVSPMDPRACAQAILIVSLTAILAAILPARRATRVDPMRALRWE